MNKLVALIALPFILGISLFTVAGKKRGQERDGLDLLAHTFEPEERQGLELHPPIKNENPD
jgi:hypothetical protein